MAKSKKKKEPSLLEIVQGVDIVGTMLAMELPRLRADIAELREATAKRSAGAGPGIAGEEIMAALTELRELLEAQEQRILKLDARLAQLAGTGSRTGPRTGEEVH